MNKSINDLKVEVYDLLVRRGSLQMELEALNKSINDGALAIQKLEQEEPKDGKA